MFCAQVKAIKKDYPEEMMLTASVSEKGEKKYQIQVEQNNESTVLLAEAELRARLRNLNFTMKTM